MLEFGLNFGFISGIVAGCVTEDYAYLYMCIREVRFLVIQNGLTKDTYSHV